MRKEYQPKKLIAVWRMPTSGEIYVQFELDVWESGWTMNCPQGYIRSEALMTRKDIRSRLTAHKADADRLLTKAKKAPKQDISESHGPERLQRLARLERLNA